MAPIHLRAVFPQLEAGRLFVFAFEVLPVPILPVYFYFPFDLKKVEHARFLREFIKKGVVRLEFIGTRKRTIRLVAVSSRQLGRIRELHGQAISKEESASNQAYDFDAAVDQLEECSRVSEVFDYLLTESQFRDLRANVAKQAVNASARVRGQVSRCVQELLDEFAAHPAMVALLQDIAGLYRGHLLLLDMQREFSGDPDGLKQFLGDSVAARTEESDLDELNRLFRFLVALTRFLGKQISQPDSADGRKNEESGRALAEALEGQSLSFATLKKLALHLGLAVGGRGGRKPKDYSAEHSWKIAGATWTEVAKRALQKDTSLQAEFSGQTFDDLDYRQQEALRKRMQQGVRTYLKKAITSGLAPERLVG